MIKIVRLVILASITITPSIFAQQSSAPALPVQQNAIISLNAGVETGLRLLAIVASWPVILFILVSMYRRELRALLPELARRVTKLPGGIELEASKQLQAFKDAALSVTEQVKDPAEADKYLAELTKKVVDATRLAPRLQENGAFSILWADDTPLNNRFESGLLENLGASIANAKTTEEALELLHNRHFDIVISDIHRVEEGRDKPEAGYELLDKIRALGLTIPFVFYSVGTPKRDQARSAFGFANTPTRLLSIVQQALGRNPIRGERPKNFS
jgi:CheY-like chemotaxis protein